jgi:hypothetical protein
VLPVHHGPTVILPNAATPVTPSSNGQPITTPGDRVTGNPTPTAVVRAGQLSSTMDSKRHEQGDAASQVPDKTPEFVVGLPTPVQPASTVDSSVATAVSQPGLPTPAEQVAMRLVPLRRGPDGIHRMTVHLNPDDLGPISVIAEVRGGAIAVQLLSATEAGRAALQASLPDLRQNLIDGGFGSCALDLQQGDQGQSQPQPQPSWGQPERRSAPVSPVPIEEAPVAGPESQSALDLRI